MEKAREKEDSHAISLLGQPPRAKEQEALTQRKKGSERELLKGRKTPRTGIKEGDCRVFGGGRLVRPRGENVESGHLKSEETRGRKRSCPKRVR